MNSRRKTEACTNTRSTASFPRTSFKRIRRAKNPTRESARLRERLLANTPSSLDPPQEPSTRREDQACTRQRKRQRNCEGELPLPSEKARSAKRARTSGPAASDKSQPLTATALARHTDQEGHFNTLALMGSESEKGGGSRGSKRRASTRNDNASMASTSTGYPDNSSQITHKSLSASNYRHHILKRANIRFQFRHVPEDVGTRIATILERQILPERKAELSRIARTLHDSFADVLDTAAREDDCIEPFYQALSSMGYGESLALPRKADWQPSLKPRVRPPKLAFDFGTRPQDEAGDSLERPSKRQQGDEPYLSPVTSDTAASGNANPKDKAQTRPPPPPQPEVKTPRPDVSIGLKDSAVHGALHSLGLTEMEAEELLEDLAMPDPRNGGRPRLHSEPTQAALQIRFPFLVVEGKSYATSSKNIYEAQNQAAVSGACSLVILHGLDDLAREADPGSYSKEQPIIVFSICTGGPTHQLWAHYSAEVNGDRTYYMKIKKTCDMGVLEEISGFLERVDNALSWGRGEHREKIANQLMIVRAAARPLS